MLGYAEYLGLPGWIVICLVILFLITQVIGEILKVKGYVVPWIMNIRGWLKDRAEEKEAIKNMPKMMAEVKTLLGNVDQHYSADNITMRDGWMKNVNTRLDENEKMFRELSAMMAKNNADTLEIKIDNKRNYLISFAACVADENYLASREQFARFFKVYDEYEAVIEENGLTNGEVDIAHQVVVDAWTERLKHRAFLEDIRGYENSHK